MSDKKARVEIDLTDGTHAVIEGPMAEEVGRRMLGRDVVHVPWYPRWPTWPWYYSTSDGTGTIPLTYTVGQLEVKNTQ